MSVNKKNQDGGNILLEVRNLAIPFSLILAKNGLEYLAKKQQASKPSIKKTEKASNRRPKKIGQKGGATAAAEQQMKESLQNLTVEIKDLLAKYKVRDV